ncbi:hypothetical protein O9K51_07757 [Purpureocillium lavendulum]|uniref:Uncharacterized protein n=1 Tax=Purpureocillium lavendulum TaxID=1247861 RepID=A0AB34FMJ3_9HYPO|nr:hypothetical protein O9K51_07757 [Purpureocillium lavendulum]
MRFLPQVCTTRRRHFQILSPQQDWRTPRTLHDIEDSMTQPPFSYSDAVRGPAAAPRPGFSASPTIEPATLRMGPVDVEASSQDGEHDEDTDDDEAYDGGARAALVIAPRQLLMRAAVEWLRGGEYLVSIIGCCFVRR